MKPILLDFPMSIITERLLIRPPKSGDGKIINEAIAETYQDLKHFMPWADPIPSLDDTEEYVRMGEANWILKSNSEPYLPLFIFEKTSMQFLGATGYHHMNWDIPSFEIGYWVRCNQRQRGYISEAVNAITRYAFLVLKAKRLGITCDVSNSRSKKIPERLGYVLEGTLKNHRIKPLDNTVSDTLIYAKYNIEHLPYLTVNWEEQL